jgi:hypothetical protein
VAVVYVALWNNRFIWDFAAGVSRYVVYREADRLGQVYGWSNRGFLWGICSCVGRIGVGARMGCAAVVTRDGLSICFVALDFGQGSELATAV